MNTRSWIAIWSLIVLAGVTLARNAIWETELSVCADSYEKSPSKPRVNHNCGLAYEGRGRDDLAFQAYRRVIRFDAGYTKAHNNLGLLFIRAGLLERAKDCFRTVLRQKPEYAVHHYRMNTAPHTEEEIVRAADAFARFTLALQYRDRGLPGKAIDEFRQALLAQPDYPDAHLNLGIAYGEQGRIDEAIHHLEAACASWPGDSLIHHNLATAYRIKGREQEAQIHLRLAQRSVR